MYEQALNQIPGVLIGRITGVDHSGSPTVSTSEDDEASADVVWMERPPRWSDCEGLRVAFALAGEDRRPLILGLLDPPPPTSEKPETLRVESRRELVIECGKSKIALRADGRIEIRGGHLISRSSGPNKIKGGSVHIN